MTFSTKLPEYRVWSAMIQRCCNPNDKSWPRYGAREIVVCARWRSFKGFYSDMGSRPSPDHQIERINNNGNYEPGNCRWADRKEQARNRCDNRVIEWRGHKRTLAEWAERCGLSQKTLHWRLKTMSMDEAMSAPLDESHERCALKVRGEKNAAAKLTEAEVIEILAADRQGENRHTIAERYGVGYDAIYKIVSGKNWRHISRSLDAPTPEVLSVISK